MRIKRLIILFLIIIIFPGLSLNAAANNEHAEIIIEIDYVDEVIRLSGKSGNNPVKYMYSPNVSAGAEGATRRQASERWYPVYGSEVDISRFIPRNDRGSGFIFAFRDADEIAGADGVFKSRRTTTIIRGRPSVSTADFRAAIIYNPRTERIEIGNSLGAYDYQFGISPWILDNTEPFIDASSKYNPLGGTFTIRASAVPGRSFASNEYTQRIPRAPAVPRVRLNERTGRLTGVQTTLQWSSSVNGPFISFRDRTGSLNIFKDNISAFATEQDASGNDCIAVYIRVASTDRLPSSPLQKLLISKSFFD